MDYVYLKEFFTDYTLPTCIIAVAVAILTLLYDRFFSDKLPLIIRSYAPFIISVLLYIAYDMLFVSRAFIFHENTMYAGLLSGSLSAVIVSSVMRIKRGKPLSISTTALLIESIITGYVREDNLTTVAKGIEEIVVKNSSDPDADALELFIRQNIKDNFSDEELKGLTQLIITAVKNHNGDN